MPLFVLANWQGFSQAGSATCSRVCSECVSAHSCKPRELHNGRGATEPLSVEGEAADRYYHLTWLSCHPAQSALARVRQTSYGTVLSGPVDLRGLGDFNRGADIQVGVQQRAMRPPSTRAFLCGCLVAGCPSAAAECSASVSFVRDRRSLSK